jgi:hypothetical protein
VNPTPLDKWLDAHPTVAYYMVVAVTVLLILKGVEFL